MKISFLVLFFFLSSIFSLKNLCATHPVYYSEQQISEQKKRLLRNRTHLELLNYIILKNGYTSYLEIGVGDGNNIRCIAAPYRVGVDPSLLSSSTYWMTSDAFFETNPDSFDLIFIDGSRLCEQVLRDVENSLNYLHPGGLIVIHDCLPMKKEQQERQIVPGAWTGDVWKAAAYIRMNFCNVHFCVIDIDFGCGILTPNAFQSLYPFIPFEDLNWKYYKRNKHDLLNIISLESWLHNF